MFENIGTGELFVVFLLVLVFFGPKKMPELGKSIGKGIREFRNAMKGIQDDIQKATKVE
jgi:sec-independent protein translocase protein TatA